MAKKDQKGAAPISAVEPVEIVPVPAVGKTSYAQRFGEAVVAADATVFDAMGVVVRREGDALLAMAAALDGCGPITTARWEAEFREPVRAAMIASNKYANKESVKVALSRHYRFALAYSNGIPAEEGESERAYVQRTADTLKAKKDADGNPVYKPANSGGKAKAKAAAKPELNAADQQAVDWLIANAMPQLRELYAKLCPAAQLDKAA